MMKNRTELKMTTHKEFLNAHKLHILKRMANHVKNTGVNKIPITILSDNINDYNNTNKLRLHALIAKIPGKRGLWVITSHGWAFLRGDKDLPRHVYIADNSIQARSDELINVRELNKGEVVIQNQFEYYNENREYLNTRPVSNSLQTSLI